MIKLIIEKAKTKFMKKYLLLLCILLISNIAYTQVEVCTDNDIETEHTETVNSPTSTTYDFYFQWTYFEEVEIIQFDIANCSNCFHETETDNGELELSIDTLPDISLCVIISGIDFNGELYCTDSVCVGLPLPVELMSFEAEKKNGNQAKLTWQTAWEEDNDGFEIVQGKDPRSFISVGWVDGANAPASYEYQTELFEGDNYFMLIQKDFDGTISESDIVVVRSEASKKTNNTRLIDQLYDSSIAGHLFDRLGQKVGSITVGINDVSNLPSGIYYVVSQDDNRSFYKK